MRPFINQIEPWFDEAEKQALANYMDQGGWLTEFQKTAELETMLAEFIGTKHCLMAANGTVSLTMALMACGIGTGDEVVCPAFTMIASAHAITLAGGTPVFVDIDPVDLCLDYEETVSAITEATRAIVLVTINGRHPDMERFRGFCDSKGIFLLEDAAQSLGSFSANKHLGTFGHIGSFSFSMPKIITTGQGGCLVTDDEELYQRLRRIKDFGRSKSGADVYEELGYNFKYTDLQAVIGIEQMKKLETRIERKKAIFAYYQKKLGDLEEIEFVLTDLDDTTPWFMDILLTGSDREEFQQYLKEHQIGVRPFYPPVYKQPPYFITENHYPNADSVAKHGVWLPSSAFLKESDQEYICQKIRHNFEEKK